MSEEEARAWLTERWGDDPVARLGRFVSLLVAASEQQNLISRSSIDQLWTRHIVDSAQLVPIAARAGRWLDVGAGAGLPGMVVAILSGDPITLLEPRALRVSFLRSVIEHLGLRNASLAASRIEAFPADQFDFITARAFAPLPRILSTTFRLSRPATLWLLPKGRSAQSEVDAARASWHGLFHMEQSITDPDSGIVVATSVRPRDDR